MAMIQLTGELRQGSGKGAARQARFAGRVPGVLYGAGEEAVMLSLSRRDLDKALLHRAGGNMIVQLRLEGATPAERMSLIREVQRHPITSSIMHIDFQHINMNKKLSVRVPVVFHGTPEGVKNMGGILEHLSREIEIRCLPGDIPERITVDVTPLAIGDSIHVRDVTVARAEILSDPDAVIATVVPPTVIEEVKPAEGEVPAEPELITKEKAAAAEPEEQEKKK